jgi:2-amino-4-hydroxy-6-hydroxymethyldihydropteridine diphosphokinase
MNRLKQETGFSLGSNMGNRLVHLQQARQALLSVPDTTLSAQSPVYETEPVDVQPEYRHLKFLNAVLAVSSPLDPWAWIEVINHIEQELGRVRSADRNAPRTIDIDLLYAGDHQIDRAGLTIPHPRWTERAFVIRPLADIRGKAILPGCTECVADMLSGMTDTGGLNMVAQDW